MLSIAAMGHGQAQYYLSLATEEYYLRGGEPPGRWLGGGAEKLGLSGILDPDVFLCLMSGYSPDGQSPLIQNAGRKDHQPGWDLTFQRSQERERFLEPDRRADAP